MIAVVQTITCTYQYQRKRDTEGRVISDIIDYYIALQIVQQAFRENLGQESIGSEDRISYIQENGPVQYKTMQNAWGISKMAVSSWINRRIREGILVFCNDIEEEFSEERELKKAKSSGKAYVMVCGNYSNVDSIGLPTPFELTGDPAWAEEGSMTEKYNLGLDNRNRGYAPMNIKGVSDNTIDEKDDIFDSNNGYDDEGLDESIPDAEIIGKDLDSLMGAFNCVYQD